MIEPGALLAWTALCVGLAVAPGADTALVAASAVRGGVGAGLKAIAGIVTGGLFYGALFGMGLLRVIAATPTLFVIVKIVGAIYLAWLGLQFLRGALKPGASSDALAAVAASVKPWRQGFLSNILNPKVALFFLAALPQFVPAGPQAPLIGAALIAISYGIGAAWLSCVALAAARVGGAVRESALSRWVEGVVGAAFVALAGRLAFERS